MLDKSVEYKSIVMKMAAGSVPSVSVPDLPDGYAFHLFGEGDEAHWARLETSVLEFPTEQAALDYFVRDYMPYLDALKQRCVFVVNREGLPVATATAWFAESILGYQASLQWVSVEPASQGKGLGRAATAKAMSLFPQLEPNQDVYLHTQTWSHIAVRLYRSIGFHLCKTEAIAMLRNDGQGVKIYPNEFAGAVAVLRTVMEPEAVEDLIRTAV